MNPICIYHGNCADGFGAAWAVREACKTFKAPYSVDQLKFHAGVYQTPPPDVTDADVIMVDFSYKRNVLLEMAAKAKSILILDHHKTAEADLVNLPENVKTVFDMKRSGARITWDFFFEGSGIQRPRLIDVIEDRDLWRFALGKRFTREIQANVFSFPYDFDVWDQLMLLDVNTMRRDGEVIERKHFKDIKELIRANVQFWIMGGYAIPVLNVPYMWTSDAGHIMWQAYGTPFAACYWDTNEGRVFSLRSRPDFDCSEVAKSMGGGGHKNASGFKVPKDHPWAKGAHLYAEGGLKLSTDLQSITGGE